MGFEYGPSLTVLHLPNDLAEFHDVLGTVQNGEPAAKRLAHLVESKCKSIVVERDYIDLDYRAGFARFYFMRHQDTDRRCIRLHFFSQRLNKRHLLNIPQNIIQGYLGFAVIRPLPGFRLGRSLLSSRLAPELPDDKLTFITCKARCRANLAGNELNFDGVPWMEQDTLVSACASAAIWVASSYLASKFSPEFKEYCTPHITDMATRYVITTGRAMPSVGLTVEQMMYAIQEMGYEPVPYEPSSALYAVNIAYRYVESGIPVIIAVQFPRGGHALTAVGHTYNPKLKPVYHHFKWTPDITLKYMRSSRFVPSFIVQDDAGGPFRRLELVDWNEAVNSRLISKKDARMLSTAFSCVAVLDRGAGSQEVGFLKALIGPVPPGVTLDGEGAELRALFALATWYESLKLKPPSSFLLRTYLQRSNQLKARFGRRAAIASARFKREFRRHLMSKWVWVTEVAQPDEFVSNNRCFGLIVQDAASHASSPDFFDLIALYLPGGLVTLTPKRGIDSFGIPGDVTLPALRRALG
jgi:hypothetical protein